ncbi:MAG TPA: YdcH family protein [Vicinamibacterales bacterium]|nr:YdcH family protein [Vicinamibacterales bacterium]HOG29559.1 YdcH family protein [Vicinamibacterales bacterium]HOQ62024.1 YdcH family protein [Vicinamibacterales bacterium]HPK72467.1 YdcH family protein [Vicinamibacterales bacterium]HPW21910.1 YdcH family protein [Vicinamibacterales bacterium]
MTVHGQDHRAMLLQTDDEYRQLAARHKELEQRLAELASKAHLSEPEHIEQVTIKKRKLQLKDRMEDIVRRSSREADRTARPS